MTTKDKTPLVRVRPETLAAVKHLSARTGLPQTVLLARAVGAYDPVEDMRSRITGRMAITADKMTLAEELETIVGVISDAVAHLKSVQIREAERYGDAVPEDGTALQKGDRADGGAGAEACADAGAKPARVPVRPRR